MKRDKSYDQILASKLNGSRRFARGFLCELMNDEDGEGLEPVVALKHTIKRMGIKEFANLSKIPEKSISRMINSNSMPKFETLEKYFQVFDLKIKIVLENKKIA